MCRRLVFRLCKILHIISSTALWSQICQRRLCLSLTWSVPYAKSRILKLRMAKPSSYGVVLTLSQIMNRGTASMNNAYVHTSIVAILRVRIADRTVLLTKVICWHVINQMKLRRNMMHCNAMSYLRSPCGTHCRRHNDALRLITNRIIQWSIC